MIYIDIEVLWRPSTSSKTLLPKTITDVDKWLADWNKKSVPTAACVGANGCLCWEASEGIGANPFGRTSPRAMPILAGSGRFYLTSTRDATTVVAESGVAGDLEVQCM